MASSLIDNRNSADAIDDVSGAQTLSTVINASANTADAGSGSCLVISDDSDDSFSHSVNVSNLKRKYVSESGNCSSSEEDDSVSILKSPKLSSIPLLVQPIRSVKASEYETPVSPSSVKVENLSSFEVVPYKMEDLEDESKDNLPNKSCRQFWKAGDYEGNCNCDPISSSVGMDHVRVHPKFLHSNATSHKWALGAFAELLDNSLDEVCNGATYVNIDMLINERDGSRMLLIEDNGGGMCPDKIRRCMSLGYSSKRNMPNTIGQYGNGFKTSTMRLGADVIVFSRCSGSDQRGPTQSIGMLSYTFLRDTGKEDIVVPMVDFEFKDDCWSKMMRSEDDWNKNLEIIAQWSPYSIEELFKQFNFVKDHGTRIIIYNLWEDDEDHLELDFDTDLHDIQIRGVNRDEKNIKMAQQYPNSRHYLTYRHSLRIYASILYLNLPPKFKIILRGKDVKHHNVADDLMFTKEIIYRPHQLPEKAIKKQSNVTIGFVKDARSHIDVQGFNVYHKNRLIKPFWRIWNPAGSDGRGVVGVLEANFVEPAHDKQGFERTIVLSRLESRLIQIQKDYWTKNCQVVGYAPRRRLVESNNNMDKMNGGANVGSGINLSSSTSSTTPPPTSSTVLPTTTTTTKPNVIFEKLVLPNVKVTAQPGMTPGSTMYTYTSHQSSPPSTGMANPVIRQPRPSVQSPTVNSNGMLFGNAGITSSLKRGKEELIDLLRPERLKDPYVSSLMTYFSNEIDKYRCLESTVATLKNQLHEATQKLEEKEKERMLQIDFSSAEIMKKDKEIATLTERLWDATASINELRGRISELENSNNVTL
ncbi:protein MICRORCHIDIA 7-like [Cucumis melo var. makuwa]|uniref:Protein MICRORCHIDIA 7-like n=1 Tax=Cucumis melo var. makuwa TaxID=1194695 RepID=A0A5A7TSG1_CUCMM|nr:protein MICRORCHIDIA 7-like [Cucumis melo var. makuwa]